jgi:hypothetical protein
MFKKGAKVKMILKCNGLWIASGKFGCTWRAEQVKINSPIEFTGYAFDDDEDDGASTEVTKVVEVEGSDNFVESEEESDDSKEEVKAESESSSESEEEEEEKPVVKKIVKKKKKDSE